MLIYLDSDNKKNRISFLPERGKNVIDFIELESSRQTDELLTKLKGLLEKHGETIKGIFVKTDQKSYTSSRITATIANFLGLSLNIQPILVNSVEEIRGKNYEQKFNNPIVPTYESTPVITMAKR